MVAQSAVGPDPSFGRLARPSFGDVVCDARCSDPSPHTQSPPYYREGSQATMSKKLVIRVQYCGGCVDVVFKGRATQNIQMGPTT